MSESVIMPLISLKAFLSTAMAFPLSFIALPALPVDYRGTVDTSILFATGFQIPAKHYRSYADGLMRFLPSSSVQFVQDENAIDGSETIEQSAAKLSRQMQLAAAETRDVVLIGHSRGGAVAAFAVATTHLASPSKISALVLLDPVDDTEKHTIEALTSSSTVFPPTLIISTPFGGSSRYYKSAVFDSICSPPDRGPEIFYTALRNNRQENPVRYLEFKSIGHLELLDERDDLVFASVCALGANAAEETDSRARQIQAMVELVLSSKTSN